MKKLKLKIKHLYKSMLLIKRDKIESVDKFTDSEQKIFDLLSKLLAQQTEIIYDGKNNRVMLLHKNYIVTLQDNSLTVVNVDDIGKSTSFKQLVRTNFSNKIFWLVGRRIKQKIQTAEALIDEVDNITLHSMINSIS